MDPAVLPQSTSDLHLPDGFGGESACSKPSLPEAGRKGPLYGKVSKCYEEEEEERWEGCSPSPRFFVREGETQVHLLEALSSRSLKRDGGVSRKDPFMRFCPAKLNKGR